MAGTPISYLVLEKGTPIVTATGARLGTVEHVLADESLDLFDGIAARTDAGLRFVDANLVTTITTEQVDTSITDADAAHLPEPDGDPVLEADPGEYSGNALSAWFGRMFMREHWTRKRDD